MDKRPESKALRWMRANPKKSMGILGLGSSILILILAEITLRLAGYYPGYIGESPWFQPVDDLWTKKGFYVDDGGIFKIEPEVRNEINSSVKPGESLPFMFWEDLNKDHKSLSTYDLIDDYTKLHLGEVKTQFYLYLKSIQTKPASTWTTLEKEIIRFSQNPVNSDGFRSIEFNDFGEENKKILLIGDSFTYGYSSDHITGSFADHLLCRDFAVYNTGISGADPSQYLALAQKYVPKLKPDFVIVNLFMGNDIQYYERPVLPGQPIFYETNAGNLYANPEGVFLESAKETYDFIMRRNSIPYQEFKLRNKLAAQTVLGTRMYLLFHQLTGRPVYGNPPTKEYLEMVEEASMEVPASAHQLREIKSIADSNDATLILMVIPESHRLSDKLPDSYHPEAFGGLDFYTAEGLTEEDYKEDGHYNNEGHRKHAETIIDLIEKEETIIDPEEPDPISPE